MVLHRLLLHYLVLQHLVELLRIRTQPLELKIPNLLIGDISLEANDISILN